MAIELTTRDCGGLTDSELEELSNLADGQRASFDVGFLSKQRDEWVLAALAHEGDRLLGGMMFTLERIGGTPCVLVNLLATAAKDHERDVATALLHESYNRALLAFPDEDVLVGMKLVAGTGYDLFSGLEDIVPRPVHRPTGEERAWSRRLAKRFGLDHGLDDRSSLARAGGSVFGFNAYRLGEETSPEFSEVFGCCKPEEGEALIVFGWAMAEKLADGSLPEPF